MPYHYPSARPDLGIKIHQCWSFASTASIHHDVLTLYLELSSLTTAIDVHLPDSFAQTPCCSVLSTAVFTVSVFPMNFILTAVVNTFLWQAVNSVLCVLSAMLPNMLPSWPTLTPLSASMTPTHTPATNCHSHPAAVPRSPHVTSVRLVSRITIDTARPQ